ncbi:MAG TPA: FecR domain-containing protein [Polyangiaceae bacterium]|nr:FecR domain-containing protein [Polyangiaceae bacterium]
MSLPKQPLRSALVGDATEQEIRDMWQGVQRLRARASHPKAGVRPFLRVALACAVVLSAFVIWFASTRATSAGPLRDARGQLPNRLSDAQSKVTLLSDGSRIELDTNSELEVLENDSANFSCVLRKGRGTFDVKPGGPRHWRIETSLVLVEVVGTRFIVQRTDEQTRVNVERGSVVVRGDRVPDGVQKLAAGQTLVVTPALRAATSSLAPALGAPAQGESTHVVALPREGGVREAAKPAALSPDLAPAARPVDLLQAADEQRRRGDMRGAIQTLRAAVVSAEPSRRAIAAFTLGKLLLDATGQASEAERAFRTCLRLSPPSSVAEDALARLVEAQARAGRTDAALTTARQYEQRYPSGRRLADVQRWANTR